MIKQIAIVSFIFFVNSCNCQKQKLAKKTIKNDKEIQLIVLNNQLKYGSPSYDNPYRYSLQDLTVILPEVKKVLKFSGYNFLTNESFDKKMQSIFNRKIDFKSLLSD
jgi:hypothetical protein